MATKLEKLRAQQEILANRVKLEVTKQKTRERKILTRKKVLLGALALSMMEKDKQFQDEVDKRLDGFLTRKIDREVFGLGGGSGPSGGVDLAEKKQETAA